MQEINLGGITGFQSESPLIIVKDYEGKNFYYYPNYEGKNIKFNLPKGRYYIKNTTHIDKLDKPVNNFVDFKLPKKERTIKIPENVKLTFRSNPNKCSVFLERGLIIFDPVLWEQLPIFARVGVLFHEIGHYYYKTEEYCDLFAIKEMLRRGFNKSQVLLVPFLSLGEFSEGRKGFIKECMERIFLKN